MRDDTCGSRPARIVSTHIQGAPATLPRSTERRLEFMVAVARAIRRKAWHGLDALVFPAGYLRTDDWLAPASSDLRRAMIDASLGEICAHAIRKLDQSSPGCVLISGIDTNRYRPWGFRGDQALAAFGKDGCLTVVRKIFPTDGDTNEDGRTPYLLDFEDAAGEERFLPLANGDQAILCLCYDSFVFSELARGPTKKLRAMRYQLADLDGWDDLGPEQAWRWLTALRRRIDEHKPRVILNPIHGFDRPGREVFWQRHGLACASSYLSGAMAIGAAHYRTSLPNNHFAMLAARSAPFDHISLGHHRPAYPHSAIESFHFQGSGRDPMNALVQLHEG